MKEKCTYLRNRIIIGIFFMTIFMFLPHSQEKILAETGGKFDIQVIDEVTCEATSITGTTFSMRSKTKVLQLSGIDNSDFDSVTWSVASGNSIAEVNSLSTKGLCQVVALKPGYATIVAEVSYKDERGVERSRTITCMIHVKFAILEEASLGFKTAVPSDERESLIMKGSDSTVELSLNYGKSSDSNCIWLSDDEDVVTVNKGKVTAVGAGKTTIHAYYLPDDSTTILKDTITVYVVPTVTDKTKGCSNNIYVHSGAEADRLISNTVYRLNGGTVTDKMDWIICTGVGGSTKIIEDSLGYINSDLIELQPSTPKQLLKIVGKSGKYSIKFFPKGIYEGYLKAGVPFDRIGQEFYSAINLYVYGEFADKDLYVDNGENFDIAQAFNVTKDVFHQMFNTSLESGSNVVTYVSSNLCGIANEAGDAVIQVKIQDTNAVSDFLDGDMPSSSMYSVRIHVSD